jgi:hypothetical protein
MRVLKDIGILPKREKMELLCDAYNCPLDFDGPGIAGFGRYCMSLPGLSYYDFQGYLRPLAAAEIRP